jgi:endonuclease-3 related protein
LIVAGPGSEISPEKMPDHDQPQAFAATEERVREYYLSLHRAWGPQHWWPASSRFEVIVGAYLTQNTAWTNVQHALRALRKAGCLSLAGIRRTSLQELEQLVRPAGYFRQKARNLKTFVAFLDREYGGSLNRMFAASTGELREQLLGLTGIGPETADSVLLYAGQHAVFVVDAYTRRIFERHEILPAKTKYDAIRQLVEGALRPLASDAGLENQMLDPKTGSFPAHQPSPLSRAKRSAEAQIYNEMHGLIVSVGKKYCLKAAPRCEECPLRKFLPGT